MSNCQTCTCIFPAPQGGAVSFYGGRSKAAGLLQPPNHYGRIKNNIL